ncbi:MAG: ATP-binding protein [Pseudomonadota bacterium]
MKAQALLSWKFRLPIALAVGLLLMVTLWMTAMWTEYSELEGHRNRAKQRLSQFIMHLQGELAKYEFLPQLLATEDRLIAPLLYPEDPARVAQTNKYLYKINKIIKALDTYLMDTKGLTVAASNWDAERPFVGENFSYRPYFKEAMRGRLGRYYALGTTSNKRGYYFAYPVRRDDRTLGTVVVKVSMASIEDTWRGGSHEFLVTDPDGVIFITTRPNWKFKALHELSTQVLQRIKDGRRYGEAEVSTLQLKTLGPSGEHGLLVTLPEVHEQNKQENRETEYLMQGKEMTEAGWTVHVLSSLDPIQEQVHRAMALSGFMFALFALIILFLIQRRHRIHEKIRFEQTARKTIEESEARVRAIIQNTHAGLVTTDQDGEVEFFNPMAEQLFGYSFHEVVGHHFTRFIQQDDQDSCRQRLSNPSDENTDSEPAIEVCGRRKDGSSFPMELSFGQMHEVTGYRFIATIHDVTERQQNEQALRQARDELELRVQLRTADLVQTNERLGQEIEGHRRTEETLHQTQDELIQAAKLAGLGQMSTAISHELNQPLSAIRSYADNARTLLDHQRMDDAHWNLAQISELTGRMAQIIKQLKLFARKAPEQSVAVPLHAVFADALGLLDSRIKQDEIQVTKEMPPEELFVLGDMIRLEQVFINLISNAVQAMSNAKQRLLVIHTDVNENRVRVTLRDTGPGIPQAHLSQIFDPFFTTKEAGQGLGLGLAISYRIIHGMGGTIKAANHPQGGAVFSVELPRATSGEGEGT